MNVEVILSICAILMLLTAAEELFFLYYAEEAYAIHKRILRDDKGIKKCGI